MADMVSLNSCDWMIMADFSWSEEIMATLSSNMLMTDLNFPCMIFGRMRGLRSFSASVVKFFWPCSGSQSERVVMPLRFLVWTK